ncbi:hypothetical protein LTR96_000338 [Exophiala xenobiotica]|nr:hypothetical protein LTR96_000338 [Exophiala xenobiotica]KAK5280395.1 hypothetical protein LTR40_006406 [Exophiala xenobiotica]KAK5338043.1 hypothetical protein LTR98_005892 [Exophiala xenobiotica]KAK5373715.1 hypothetical protein LTS13_005914 [Exophiala xenobiotica]KAK5402395.1 hypothetical protein LTR79_001123 [Exophiala xenobiotica]
MVDGVVLAEGEDRSTRAVFSPYHGHSPADYGDSTPPKGPDEAVQASSVRIERFIGLSSDLDPYILRHKAWSPVQARREAQWSCHRYSKDVLTPAHFEVVFKHQPRIIAESSLQRQLEETVFPYQPQLMVAFCRHVHPSYPLLDADRLSHAVSHPVLKIALCCIAHPFCPAAQSAIRRELYETYEFEVLGAKNRFATLETIEAALLFAQRHPYSITFVKCRPFFAH